MNVEQEANPNVEYRNPKGIALRDGFSEKIGENIEIRNDSIAFRIS